MFALCRKRAIVHALVFVRLAHDRRFVGAVLFLLVLVRFRLHQDLGAAYCCP
jgi:hypothetical protein